MLSVGDDVFYLYVAPTSSQRVIREQYIVSEKCHRFIILTTIHGIGVDVPFASISQQRLHPSSSYCIFSIVTLKPVQIEKQRIQRKENGGELLSLRKGNNMSCLLACFP